MSVDASEKIVGEGGPLGVGVLAWVWRVGVVVGVVAGSVFVAFWKMNAAAGTFEANLSARASVLGSLVAEQGSAEQVAAVFPQLKAGGADRAEVWDGAGVSVFRSAGLKAGELKAGGVEPRRLYKVKLTDVGDAYAVWVPVFGEGAGASLVKSATYVSTRSPFAADWLQSGVIFFVFAVLPSVAFVVFCPLRGRPRTAG